MNEKQYPTSGLYRAIASVVRQRGISYGTAEALVEAKYPGMFQPEGWRDPRCAVPEGECWIGPGEDICLGLPGCPNGVEFKNANSNA